MRNLSKVLLGVGLALILVSLHASQADAAGVTSVTIYASRSSNQILVNVRAFYDTSGLFGFGCIDYKIKIKESRWYWFDKTRYDKTFRGEYCYIGKYPNPIQINKLLGFTSNSFGKGIHKIYAEVYFASGKIGGWVTSWEKGRSNSITVTVR